ncbi:hypothetical protein GCM10027346_32720 [Hymenobacter seoulensis]
MPRGIHEWAQADRLALAISYYDRGLHFFRPQTLSFASIDGVGGVEFPITPFLAALGAKLTGRGSLVIWYRGLNIGVAVVGCYYLFRLVFERTRHVVAALLPGVFLATSPVFAYYAGSFLPDPMATSLTLVASYYLLRYDHQSSFCDLLLAIAVFTLATLIKTSAATYLLAALGTVVLWSYLRADLFSLRQKLIFLATAVASVGAVVGYALFNRHLNEQYQSTQFIAVAVPIENDQQYEAVVTRIKLLWQFEYFTPVQYYLLAASIVIILISLPRLIRTEWLWLSQIALAAMGGWMFFWLMGRQFLDHDYYVLAPFWPGLVLLFSMAIVRVATWNWLPVLARESIFAVGIIVLLAAGLPHHRARTGDPYKQFSDYYTYRWMEGGAQKLAEAQVPAHNTLLVLGEEAPNLALVYFDRRGLVWKPDLNRMPSAELLEKMTNYGLDCLVMRQAVFQDLQHTHPDLLPAFQEVVTTDQYVVLRRRSSIPHW